MKLIKLSLIILGGISAISLGACSSNDPAAKTESTTTNSTPAAKGDTTAKVGEKPTEGNKDKHTGQVVQVGKYHVEFNPHPDKDAMHLDTVLHGDDDKQIIDAKLNAQVQLPDGTNKTLPLAYNTEEKQYTASLPVAGAGEYKVVLQVDVKGEKFNSRFSFKK
jgi:hypothetical protein